MPIIVFYCEGCREPVTDRKILDSVVELFAEHTADIWYERTAAELMPAGHDVRQVRRRRSSRKENDILDVWFDSGSSHLAVLDDEHRTALAGRHVPRRRRPVSRLVPQLAAGRRRAARARSRIASAPLNGWTLDGEGRAMPSRSATSSSRRRSSSSTARKCCGCGSRRSNSTKTCASPTRSSTRLTDAYRKLRNTFRYVLGNLADFDPANRCGAGGPSCSKSISGFCCEAEDLVRKLPRLVRRIRVPQGLPRGLRLRDGAT